MAEKAVEQLLSLNPERLQLASENIAVRKWNLDILDDLVQTAVNRFPSHPTREELENYHLVNRRLRQFSRQFIQRGEEESEKLAEHIKELAEKIYLEDDPRINKLFSSYITKKILKFGGVVDTEAANQYRLKLIHYVESKLIVAIPHLKRKEDREKVCKLLENLVAAQTALERYDVDGALDDALRYALKQFLFNGIMSHHIYQSLLSYEPQSFPASDLEYSLRAAEGINHFILHQLTPYLQDPDVEPRREEIENIVENLKVLNKEFSSPLLNPSIEILESFL